MIFAISHSKLNIPTSIIWKHINRCLKNICTKNNVSFRSLFYAPSQFEPSPATLQQTTTPKNILRLLKFLVLCNKIYYRLILWSVYLCPVSGVHSSRTLFHYLYRMHVAVPIVTCINPLERLISSRYLDDIVVQMIRKIRSINLAVLCAICILINT